MNIDKYINKKWLQYGIVALCAIFIIKYFMAHTAELKLILNLNLFYITIILLFNLLIHLIASYKMYFVLKKLGLHRISYYQWLKIFSISRFLNFHITQGANVYRSVVLKKEHGFSYTNSISMLTFMGWAESVFILLISCLSIALINKNLSIEGINIFSILLILFIVFLISPFIAQKILRKVSVKIKYLNWVHSKLDHLSEIVIECIKNTDIIFKIFLLSVLAFACYLTAIHASFEAIGIVLSLDEVILFVVIILLNGIINITPSNIGIMELMCGYLSLSLGGTLGYGIIACSILRVLGYLMVAFLTLLWSKDFISIKRIEQSQ
jgi:uncharacterized protein (TIRG00374 family)